MAKSKTRRVSSESQSFASSASRSRSRMFLSPSMPAYVSHDKGLSFTEAVRDYPVALSYETQLRLQMVDSSLQSTSSSNSSDDLLFESENVDVPSVEVVYEGSRFERLDAAFEARCVDQLNAARASSVASLASGLASPPPPPSSVSSASSESAE